MTGATTIHPTAVIGPDVDLGAGSVVSPYAVILGPCRIGDRSWIGPHVAIGTPAQIREGEHRPDGRHADGGGIFIGGDTVVREFVTVHQPTMGETRIGDRCYVMSYAHIPHDATVGDDVTISNAVQLGGHTTIGDWANLGLSAVVHQWLAVGGGAMVGMGSVVTKDVSPFAVVYGNPARPTGVNTVGLQRAGFDEDLVATVLRDREAGGPAGYQPVDLPPRLQAIFAAHEAAVGRRR